MRRDQAPRPGWYPDPTGGTQLWWWDGLDWTSHRRTTPPADHGGLQAAADAAAAAAGATAGAEQGARVPSQHQLRARGAATRSAERAIEQETAEVVAQARRAARAEVDRAVKEATAQFEEVRTRFLPRLDEWRRTLRRWSRWTLVVVFLLALLWLWVQATFSVGLLEWLGQRIDAVTGVVVVGVADPSAVPLPALR